MELPSHEPLVRREERVRAQLREFAAQRGEDPLVWCHLPRLLWVAHARRAERHQVPERLSGAQARRIQRLHVSRRGRAAPGGISAQLGGGCLFMATRTNMLRSQAPLYERFGPLEGVSAELRSSLWQARRLTRRALALAGDLVEFARCRDLELPTDSESLHQMFLRTARLLGLWEELLAVQPPRVVIVGSVWQPRARALLHAARRAGIPSVFIPHSPLLSDVGLMDFGVDYAGLRGTGEADLLARHGVDARRLEVIGDPSIAVASPPHIDPDHPVVFAPNNERPNILVPLIGVIREALGASVMVARHPNFDPEDTSGFPPDWRMHRGRTYDLLRAGAPVVLQQSSGVAVEALQLGIPVVELHFPGERPNYPVIREPYVPLVSDSSQLAAAVASAQEANRTRREQLIDWGRRWAWPAGADAGRRTVALVERAMDEGPHGPIWDSLRDPR